MEDLYFLIPGGLFFLFKIFVFIFLSEFENIKKKIAQTWIKK